MYVVLTGAKANLGDFLITERTKALLGKLRPEHELVQVPAWEPLEPHLDTVRQAAAVIIMGGPGYQPGFHGKVYPLCQTIETLPAPLVPLGLGWKGVPGDATTVARYQFTARSLQALRAASRNPAGLGCRDYLSAKILRRHGLERTTMTGCPVWYDLESMGRSMTLPDDVKRLVYTPAHSPLFKEQSKQIARSLASLFPEADKICSFHRGYRAAGRWKPQRDLDVAQDIGRTAEGLGFECRDVSGSLEKIGFYDECDFHVGYRVHAHLYFLSKRRPSLLIHEDGRGMGQSHALDLMGIDAMRRTTAGRFDAALPAGLGRLVPARGTFEADPSVPTRVAERIVQDLESRFSRYAGVGRVIDRHFTVMESFIRRMP